MDELLVRFHDTVDDGLVKFAVIAARYKGKWVFCKHRERSTYEIPGGHREEAEEVLKTAKRELYEETGAVEFRIDPVCAYSVAGKNSVNTGGEETYGMLYFAEIEKFGEIPESEIEKTVLVDDIPKALTYPLIQPRLFEKVREVKGIPRAPA